MSEFPYPVICKTCDLPLRHDALYKDILYRVISISYGSVSKLTVSGEWLQQCAEPGDRGLEDRKNHALR